jgi:hypothetical protein
MKIGRVASGRADDEPNLNDAASLAFTLSTKTINMKNYQCDEHDSAIVST